MIINLLCKAFIAILDILLLDFYLKNIYPSIYRKNFIKINFFIYVFIFFLMLFVRNSIMYFYIHLIILIIILFIFSFYSIDKFDFLKKIFIFYSLNLTIYIVITIFLSWLFNSRIYTFHSYCSLSYTLLAHILLDYIIYCILIFKNKYLKINFNHFKKISIFIIFSFTLIFIINNPILFKIISIARTYIFTVVISIIALICFDRMQTKYETDKHNKEAIIQNMAKEEEFVQELEKQQLEIRKINHNLNHILIILQSHLKQGEYKEALEYIDKNLDIHIKAYQALTHTGMTMIDSTINHQIYQMKEQNIEYDEEIAKILHLGSIVPDDLSLVLGLAFDNAREACEKVKDQRKISLKLQSKQTHIIIHITNSIPRGSHPYFHKTSKKDSVAHGYGVKGIKEIAKKYHGDVKYDVKDDCVVLRIMLQK